MLSTDIAQIAELVFHRDQRDVNGLQESLEKILKKSAVARLRPELMHCLFKTMLKVLLRPRSAAVAGRSVWRVSRSTAFCSFPCLPGCSTRCRPSYARTTVGMPPNRTTTDDWRETLSDEKAYDEIRRCGRHTVLGRGAKKLAREDFPCQFGPSDKDAEPPLANDPRGQNLLHLLNLLTSSRHLDTLVRRNHGQPHAVAGDRLGRCSTCSRDPATLRGDLKKQLSDVIADNIRSLERDAGSQAVITEVHMDREVVRRASPLAARGLNGPRPWATSTACPCSASSSRASRATSTAMG